MHFSVWAFYVSCLLAFVCGHTINYVVILYSQEALQSDLLSGLGFGLCFGLPLLLGWVGGVLADWHSPNRIVLVSLIGFLLACVLLTLSIVSDSYTTKVIFLLVASLLAGCGWSFIAPARYATVAQLVSADKLHSATIIINIFSMVGLGVAPLVIGFSFDALGWRGIVTMALSGFVVAAVLMLFCDTAQTPRPQASVLREIKLGIRAVRSHTMVYQLLMAAVVFFIIAGPLQVLLPASG